MQVKLRIVGGKHTGKEIEIRGESFVIGRGEGCDLRPVSETVSRRHCELVTDADRALVRDLGSSNGTLVNDVRIQGEHRLSPGDRLKVGPLHFEVLLIAPPQDFSPRVDTTKATVECVPSDVKSKSEDYILDWLTDTPASTGQVATVDLKPDETHAQPRPPLTPHANLSNIPSPQVADCAGQRMARLAKLTGTAPDEPADVKDASEAAGAVLGEFISTMAKIRNRV